MIGNPIARCMQAPFSDKTRLIMAILNRVKELALPSEKSASTFPTSAALAAALAAVLCIYYFDYLCNRASFFIEDIMTGWQPFLSYIGDRYSHGQLPLWNPYAASGISQVAVIAPCIFYPLFLLFAAMPFNPAYACLLIAQQVVAGVSMFLLIRSFGWNILAAWLGGVALGLSGVMFSLQPTPTLQGTLAWFVASWWAVKTIDMPSPSTKLLRTALAAVCVFLLITSGVAEIVALGMLFLGIFSLFELAQSSKANKRQRRFVFLLRILAMVLGIGLAACTLLPAAEWYGLSQRSHGLPSYELFSWSGTWYDLAGVMLIHPLGDLFDPLNPRGALIRTATTTFPYLSDAYLGPVIVTLALWAVTNKSFAVRFWAIACVVVSLLIVFAGHFPFLGATIQSLHLTMFRYPIKAIVFTVIAMVLLAARGMHAFTTESAEPDNRIPLVLWTACVTVGIVLLVTGYLQPAFLRPYLVQEWFVVMHGVGEAALVAGIAGVLTCSAVRIPNSHRPTVAVCLILLTALLLLSNAYPGDWHAAPPDFYTRPALVSDLIKSRATPQGTLVRCAATGLTTHIPTTFEPEQPRVVSVYQGARQLMIPNQNVAQRVDNVAVVDIGLVADHAALWRAARDAQNAGNFVPLSVLCRMCAANQMVCQLGLNDNNGNLGTRFKIPDSRLFVPTYANEQLNVAVYKVQNALPRAYFANVVKWGSPHDAVIGFLKHADSTGFDPALLTILEHQDVHERGPALTKEPNTGGNASVSWLVDEPELIRLDVSTKRSNFLVLADQYYPGWTATINGAQTEIYRANVLGRAVLVPAGRHMVEYRYLPRSLIAGFAIGAIFCAGVVVLLLLAVILRSRNQEQ